MFRCDIIRLSLKTNTWAISFDAPSPLDAFRSSKLFSADVIAWANFYERGIGNDIVGKSPRVKIKRK
jgi:hypothetical protein